MNDLHVSTQAQIPVFYPFSAKDIADAENIIEQEIIPELENGDRLTRAEFERRYDAMPDLKKAELINGVVYMGSPVRHKKHSRPHSRSVTWMGVYNAATPGTDSGDNGSVRLDDENMPQPDAMLRLESESGGRSEIDEDDYLAGPPELALEVASSSAAYDLHDKKDTYAMHEVQEYIVWRIKDRQIDWFRLEGGEYIHVAQNEDGVIESSVFPGLRLAVPAMLAGDMAAVLAELQKGLDSDEHKAFVEKLAAMRAR